MAPWEWPSAWVEAAPAFSTNSLSSSCLSPQTLCTTLLQSPPSALNSKASQSLKFLYSSQSTSQAPWNEPSVYQQQRPLAHKSPFPAMAHNCLSEIPSSTHFVLIRAIHKRKTISPRSLQVIIFCPAAWDFIMFSPILF